MTIEGYVAKSSYRDVDMYLSGTKWVDNIEKIKVEDIKAFMSELNMEDWPLMDKKYSWIYVTITIEL